jgi:hypothetical protein
MSMLLAAAMMLSSSTVMLPGGEDGVDLELTCEIGPVDRSYGGSDFSLYSCDDGKSLVAVAKPGSKAYPFFFIVSPDRGQVKLYGEGDGDEDATHAAFADLNEVTPAEVAAIVKATKSRAQASAAE